MGQDASCILQADWDWIWWTGEEAAETIGPAVDYLDGLSRPRQALHQTEPSTVPVLTVGRH